MGLLDLFSNDAAKDAAGAQTAGLRAGFGQATKYLDQGAQTQRDQYGKAIERYEPLYAGGQAGYNAYGDAAGLGGAEGIGRATEAFRAIPGYSGGLTTGLDALDRRAASRGMLASGNNEQDTIKFASDYDAGKYGQYVQQLAPYLQQFQNTAGAMAGLDTGLGDDLSGIGQQKANYAWQTETGIGDANASAELARQSAAKNTFDAITGGLSLAGKFLGVGGFAPATNIFAGR